ncbi:MAG: radical SAM protein [Saprospiraceae bacterium]|nr:radical SAM protein [Saprospiraceae bacterium]
MSATIFLLTPPFTQLNTPYPATSYLKGFLNTKGISCFHADLGIEVILKIFSKKGLTEMFELVQKQSAAKSKNARRIIAMKDQYIQIVVAVVSFLQGKNPTLAHLICQDEFLPEASRFSQLDDLEWAFGSMGIQDKAKHLSTLFLEDLSDLIQECLDPHFGFSRYAERLGRSANSFDELYEALQQPNSFVDQFLESLLSIHIETVQPKLVGISVPFPGNLFSAFRCAQWIKNNHPHIRIAMGGGFPNTELRSLSEPRVFEFFDFITLDDGEAPIEHLIEHVEGKRPVEMLKRTFALTDGRVEYFNFSLSKDYPQAEVGTPDYSDLLLNQYISVLEIANPMHRLWSDGRWNKLTMAHGCYWGKCTFCDISLDYIKVYEPIAAGILCDRIETLIAQTGENGFHFVDEAAPPALMRALALEIIKRKLVISWWTNIRFEKSFSADLCRLLKASGCIAVSGGLEVASDRLLQLIDKGVTVAQVARVTRNFTDVGILVHAYLMYGFPTQTEQETIDSLEMVRQLFAAGCIQSGFWHQFAMTAHAPVGINPEKFGAVCKNETIGTFANNDLIHEDPTGADHELYSFGLKKSLFNFMHGIGLDYPAQSWFEFDVSPPSVESDYIESTLDDEELVSVKPSTKLSWIGPLPEIKKSKKEMDPNKVKLSFQLKKGEFKLQLDISEAKWLTEILPLMAASSGNTLTYDELKKSYESSGMQDFGLFWHATMMYDLRDCGLLIL